MLIFLTKIQEREHKRKIASIPSFHFSILLKASLLDILVIGRSLVNYRPPIKTWLLDVQRNHLVIAGCQSENPKINVRFGSPKKAPNNSMIGRWKKARDDLEPCYLDYLLTPECPKKSFGKPATNCHSMDPI